MSTALDIITQALRRIGVYGPNDTITDADAQDCLVRLNDMLDMWSNENLMCLTELEQSGALVVAQNSYTIGSGGNFNVTRPIKIKDGAGAAYIQDTNGNNFPVDVVQRDQWNLIGNRGSSITSNYPTTFFYDPQYPLGVLNVFPTPNTTFTAFWDSYLQLTDFATLSSSFSMPPGYKKAMQDNLAIEIWPDFWGDGAPQLLTELASKSKAAVKRANTRPVVAVYDPELVSRSQSSYNIYRDSSSTT